MRRLSPKGRVYLVAGALIVGSAALYGLVLDHARALEVPFHVTWWQIALLSLAAELLVVRLESRGETQTLSLGDVPVTIGLALASPIGLLVGRLAGAGFSLAIVRRQQAHKLVFNLSLFAFETAVAGSVYRAFLGGADPIELRAWLAALAAVLAADAVSVFGVTAVIALYAGAPRGASIRRALSVTWLTGIACTGIGLGVVASLWYEPLLSLILVPVVGAVYAMNRTYLTLSQRYRSLESLHRFTRDVGRSLDMETVGEAVLKSALELMRGEAAHLILLGDDDDAMLISADEDHTWVRPLSIEQAAGAVRGLAPGHAARLIGDPSEIPEWLAPEPPREAAVALVEATDGALGLLLVMNARQDVSGFDRRDLTFFETLANHASKAIENSRLYRRLQGEATERTRQALHDPLTGLPNRHQLDERLVATLEEAGAADRQVAILLLDLELFKEVNDTLGHHAGDNILRSVCHRLEEVLPEGALLARFGGDEFVALLPDVASAATPIDLAEILLAALDQPFLEQELDIAIGASVGIALFPDHALTASTLLQRADVAMYHAKGSRSGYEVYSLDIDPFTPRRLALAGQIREAVERREIEMVYQPQIELATGLVTGVEALVRWRHPRLGLLTPDEFIPAAEHTGAIKPLTVEVLALSLDACRSWRASGLDLTISVNLSVTSLLDLGLPDDVGRLLQERSLPPEVLMLELTEGSIMTESRRSVRVLTALDDMGVQLSIDDFGTGYSSLSHLRRLPVSEIKIDRSFVAGLTLDEHDAVIVRTTIELGHQLGLRVVAEGAESLDSLDRLRELGCDGAQGFVISRPRSPASLSTWLRSQQVGELRTPVPAASLEARRALRGRST
jgi:diguanylate cyclase (GGDEF)-like protein